MPFRNFRKSVPLDVNDDKIPSLERLTALFNLGSINAFGFGLELNKSIAAFEDDGCAGTSGNLEIKSRNAAEVFAASHTSQESFERWIRFL
ncbi:MAG: hypothetical protein OXI60_07700 [Acidiferrobacterales bacterium]|nr:hypothetical protein [Acidiferrobacterales bacterium]